MDRTFETPPSSALTTRKVVVAGVLAAIAIVLGSTPIGFVPVPTAAGSATTMHIPAIIGGVLEGTVVGWLIGTIFGVYSFLRATLPLFKDPLVAILPRMFIGITAYGAYAALRWRNEILAVGVAAAVGTLTNTIGVLTMAVVRGYLATGTALAIGVTQGIPEIIVAVIITIAVVAAWKHLEYGRTGSRI
jgi:uncharacterized membrane protein